jgi:cation-transporting ATPase E
LTLISALTIGVPSFFLAMEPNYERVSGKFLPTVLARALPGVLANLILVLLAQLLLPLLALTEGQISTICAAILAVVGMLVLRKTCKPFTPLRHGVWWVMAAALIFCFTFLRGFFFLTF